MTTTSPLGTEGIFAPPPEAKRNDELGQADFLKLMITQFKNQDPFEPMDNGDFLSQLAQFSTVNGIESLNTAFSGLASSIRGEQALQGANLVGHRVLAVSDTGFLEDNGSIDGAVELDASAGDVQVDVLSPSGELVQRLSLGAQPAGLARFSWNGVTAGGEIAPPGDYRISARVVRGQQIESVPTAIESTVESVTLGVLGDDMQLNVRGGQSLSLSQVYQII